MEKKQLTGGFDGPIFQDGIAVVRIFDDAESCGLDAGIDPENPHVF